MDGSCQKALEKTCIDGSCKTCPSGCDYQNFLILACLLLFLIMNKDMFIGLWKQIIAGPPEILCSDYTAESKCSEKSPICKWKSCGEHSLEECANTNCKVGIPGISNNNDDQECLPQSCKFVENQNTCTNIGCTWHGNSCHDTPYCAQYDNDKTGCLSVIQNYKNPQGKDIKRCLWTKAGFMGTAEELKALQDEWGGKFTFGQVETSEGTCTNIPAQTFTSHIGECVLGVDIPTYSYNGLDYLSAILRIISWIVAVSWSIFKPLTKKYHFLVQFTEFLFSLFVSIGYILIRFVAMLLKLALSKTKGLSKLKKGGFSIFILAILAVGGYFGYKHFNYMSNDVFRQNQTEPNKKNLEEVYPNYNL